MTSSSSKKKRKVYTYSQKKGVHQKQKGAHQLSKVSSKKKKGILKQKVYTKKKGVHLLSKVSSIVTWHSTCPRTRTFQNLCVMGTPTRRCTKTSKQCATIDWLLRVRGLMYYVSKKGVQRHQGYATGRVFWNALWRNHTRGGSPIASAGRAQSNNIRRHLRRLLHGPLRARRRSSSTWGRMCSLWNV